MYESTEDIHTIQPNLDMIQRAIDYLRGSPMRDELKPVEDPKDTLHPLIVPTVEGVSIETTLVGDNDYLVNIVGIDINSRPVDKDWFGDTISDVMEIAVDIPVICGMKYTIVQRNNVLQHYYPDDPTIDKDLGGWYKMKTYVFEDDQLTYKFLIPSGYSTVELFITQDNDDLPMAHFKFMSHIHFKKQEVEDNDTE